MRRVNRRHSDTIIETVTRKVVPHYGDDVYEPIKVIEAYGLGFNTGNAIKYILRAGRKNGESRSSDIQKAFAYMYREIHGVWPPAHDET